MRTNFLDIIILSSVEFFEGLLNRCRNKADVIVDVAYDETSCVAAQLTRVPVDGASVGDDQQEEDDEDEDGERQEDKDVRKDSINPLEQTIDI